LAGAAGLVEKPRGIAHRDGNVQEHINVMNEDNRKRETAAKSWIFKRKTEVIGSNSLCQQVTSNAADSRPGSISGMGVRYVDGP